MLNCVWPWTFLLAFFFLNSAAAAVWSLSITESLPAIDRHESSQNKHKVACLHFLSCSPCLYLTHFVHLPCLLQSVLLSKIPQSSYFWSGLCIIPSLKLLVLCGRGQGQGSDSVLLGCQQPLRCPLPWNAFLRCSWDASLAWFCSCLASCPLAPLLLPCTLFLTL